MVWQGAAGVARRGVFMCAVFARMCAPIPGPAVPPASSLQLQQYGAWPWGAGGAGAGGAGATHNGTNVKSESEPSNELVKGAAIVI